MLTTKKPTAEKSAAAAEKMETVEARLVARIPEALHRKLKAHVAQEGTTIQDYLVALLQKNLSDKAA